MMQVTTEFHFSAGHRLPGHAGPCRAPHGHNYRLLVSLEGPVDPKTGMVIDFYRLRQVVQERIIARVDHLDLNEILENPTAENIAAWIWRELHPDLPMLSEICLYEVHDCCVRYRGEQDGRP